MRDRGIGGLQHRFARWPRPAVDFGR